MPRPFPHSLSLSIIHSSRLWSSRCPRLRRITLAPAYGVRLASHAHTHTHHLLDYPTAQQGGFGGGGFGRTGTAGGFGARPSFGTPASSFSAAGGQGELAVSCLCHPPRPVNNTHHHPPRTGGFGAGGGGFGGSRPGGFGLSRVAGRGQRQLAPHAHTLLIPSFRLQVPRPAIAPGLREARSPLLPQAALVAVALEVC